MPVFPQQGPVPQIPGRVLGWDGWKREFLPFFFATCPKRPHRPLSLQRASSPVGSSPMSSSFGSSTSSGPSSPGPRYFWGGDGDRRDTGGSPRLCQTLTGPPRWGWVHQHGLRRGKPRPSPKPDLFQARCWAGIELDLNSLTSKSLSGSRLEIAAWVTPSIHPKKKKKQTK